MQKMMLLQTIQNNSVIYAVFTTPQNAIPGSAVCMFKIDDIIETFEGLYLTYC